VRNLMKQLLLALLIISGVPDTFAQGDVSFNNHVTGVVVTHVYAPLSANPTFHRTGNGSDDTPAGAQDWTGFTLVGINGTAGQYGGATTFAQLLGAPRYNQPESSLQPASPTTTFRTGSLAGFVARTTATFNNIPVNAPEATIEMVAWDNSSGLYPTWSQAFPAWQAGLIAAGESGRWNLDNFSGTLPPPEMINSQDPSQHVVSFNLYFIPEPTVFALIGLGTVILIFSRSNSLIRRT
jgi:hypothetical protein